jgi:tetratricopeptide (TPR) repeat protein
MILGNYQSMKGEREQAILSFSRALKLNPHHSPAYTLMGHEYVELCNPQAAIQVYRKAVGTILLIKDINQRDYRAWYGYRLLMTVLDKHMTF